MFVSVNNFFISYQRLSNSQAKLIIAADFHVSVRLKPFCVLIQVKFKDNRTLMNVNISDFFLHVFDELIDPKSDMFMYNDNQTLAWFPPKVNLLDGNSISLNLLMVSLKCVHSPEKKSGSTFCLACCVDWRSSTRTWSTCRSPWFSSRSCCESNPPWMT